MRRRSLSPKSDHRRPALSRFQKPTGALDEFEAPADVLSLNSDPQSLETQTNFNWNTTFKEREEASVNQVMPTQDFLQSSHYYIDQLKSEFCTAEEDEWFQVTQPTLPSQPSIDQTLSGPSVNSGRWTKEEHQKFLEGLRLYGKDWPKIQKHIRTRCIKNVMSHAQKFLVKLVKFISSKEDQAEMTVEEAEHFHGILNQRTHRFSNLQTDRDNELQRLKAQGAIFRVHKIQRRKKRAKKDSEEIESFAQPQSSYERWRRKIGGDQFSFHQSLGDSIKVVEEVNKAGKSIIKFKSLLQSSDCQDGQSNSSGGSLNANYIRKFELLDASCHLRDDDIFQAYRSKIHDAIYALPDLEEDEQIEDIVLCFANGREFRMLESYPLQSLFTQLTLRSPSIRKLAKTRPRLVQFMIDKTCEKLNLEKHGDSSSQSYAVWEYMCSQTKAEILALLEGGIKIYYMK